MTGTAPTLLLLSPSVPAAGRVALRTALADLGPALAPEWTPGEEADVLAAPLAAALAALDSLGSDPAPAVVCGWGAGTLVALRLALAAPDRVGALLLGSGARALGTTVRSVHRGVAELLPVEVLQRLGGRGSALLPLLDAVRPVDCRRLAPQVRTPALVPWGGRDRVNRRPSQLLARALPDGRAVEVRGAGPGWWWREPERVRDLAGGLRERR